VSDSSQQEDRTQAATPRRLQRAREEGQVPISRELNSLVGLCAVTLTLVFAGAAAARELATRLAIFLSQAHVPGLAGPVGYRLAWNAFAHAAGPFLLAALVAGCGTGLVQSGFLIHIPGLLPNPSRISPAAGVRRLLSTDSLTEAGKSMLKIAVMGVACWFALRSDIANVLPEPRRSLGMLLPDTLRPVLHVLLVVLGVEAVLAGLDVAWVRYRHGQRLRMSRHDLREEQREMEGDPRIKQRIRQIRLARARKRMMAAVPKATVVVTNPTHYAVALAYDRTKNEAPRVVAKGVDSLAARIREVAQANRVPLVANPPLAQALYRVELDREIPAEHYKAVAEIIAYVWRLARPARGVGMAA
jgi:flagellar biosynthetic protein FlhB